MTIEELMINFNNNNWSNVTILILKISMKYIPNIQGGRNKGKNLMKFKRNSKLKYHNNLDQIYIQGVS